MATKKLNADLPDSKKDNQKLQPEDVTLDMPEVKDIPGQENIKVPDLREMADTTISSADEEGIGVFEDENGDDASSERIGPAETINEDDLIIRDDELEETLDEDEVDDTVNDDIDIINDTVSEDADVTAEEKEALERTDNMNTQDNENLYRAELDDTDLDGEKLNEDSDNVSGKDLDVPGEEDDDANEEIGEEDEENNEYSLGDTQ